MDMSSDWDSLFVNNPSLMWAFHVLTLYFVDVNHATLAWSGYRRAEFLNLRIHDVHPADKVSMLRQLIAADVEPLHVLPLRLGVIPFRKKDGSFAFVKVMAQPVRENTIYMHGKEERLSGSESDARPSATSNG
jgi:PAS domain S-box-containing protein